MENSKTTSAQKNRIKSFFNRTRGKWDNLYSGQTFINLHMKERKQIVLDFVDVCSNGNRLQILDLGCGSGVLTRELLNVGHTVTGADIAEELLIILNKSLSNNREKNYRGAVLCDAGNVAFNNESFDLVLCIGVLQYQLRDEIVLREIDRLLQKGGICIATFPNLLRINYFLDPFFYIKFIYRFARKKLPGLKRFKKKNRNETTRLSGTFQDNYPYDKKYYLNDIKKLFWNCNFDIIKIISFGYGPFTIFNKSIFSESLSFAISTSINKLAAKSRLEIFNYIANRWVFVVKKGE